MTTMCFGSKAVKLIYCKRLCDKFRSSCSERKAGSLEDAREALVLTEHEIQRTTHVSSRHVGEQMAFDQDLHATWLGCGLY